MLRYFLVESRFDLYEKRPFDLDLLLTIWESLCLPSWVLVNQMLVEEIVGEYEEDKNNTVYLINGLLRLNQKHSRLNMSGNMKKQFGEDCELTNNDVISQSVRLSIWLLNV